MKKFASVAVGASLLGAVFLLGASSADGQTRAKRAPVKMAPAPKQVNPTERKKTDTQSAKPPPSELLRQRAMLTRISERMGDPASVSTYRLKQGIPRAQEAMVVKRLNASLGKLEGLKGAPGQPLLSETVREWKRLNPEQQLALLKGNDVPSVANTWAVAVVGAVALAYHVYEREARENGSAITSYLTQAKLDKRQTSLVQGAVADARVHDLLQSIQSSDVSKMRTLVASERVDAAAFRRLDQQMQTLAKLEKMDAADVKAQVGLSKEVVSDAVALWQSMPVAARQQLAAGQTPGGAVAVPTWAVAAVGAAALAYEAYADYREHNKDGSSVLRSSKLQMRTLNPKELNYMNGERLQFIRGQRALPQEALDYR